MRTQTHHLSDAEQQLVKTFDDLKLPVSNYNQSYLGFVFPSKQQWEHFTFGLDPGWKTSPALCKPAYSEKALKDENIVTHLLNNWGHYEKRSCALLSALALSPCCGVQSIPQSWFQDRLGDHPSLCDPGHPQQRGSQAEMCERTSHEWRPMKFSILSTRFHFWLAPTLPPRDICISVMMTSSKIPLGITRDWVFDVRQWGKQRKSCAQPFTVGPPLP